MLPLSIHILFLFQLESSKCFWEALAIAILFSYFKETTHASLLNLSITYNKKIRLLNLIINCTLDRSPAQIFSIKDECPFCFSNFLIIGFGNYSAYYWFNLFSFLPAPPEFLSKQNYKTLTQDAFDIYHIGDF